MNSKSKFDELNKKLTNLNFISVGDNLEQVELQRKKNIPKSKVIRGINMDELNDNLNKLGSALKNGIPEIKAGHELKILPQYFKQVIDGNKTFELRKDDRNFAVGDIVKLSEYFIENRKGYFTEEYLFVKITYLLKGGQFGLENNYCIFSFEII